MNYKIKRINKEDAYDYMKVNTISWIQTYKGIVSDEFLTKIEKELYKNAINLKNKMNPTEDYRYLLYYENKPVGNSSIGPSRIEEYPTSGEIESIYLLDEVKDKGLGKKLFEHDKNKLKKLGYKDMVIGCLKDNIKANGFYQHMGGELVFTRTINIGNQPLQENIYYFNKI